MEELLASETREEILRPLRTGDVVRGSVAAISGEEATIDLGDRPAGVIAIRDTTAELHVGDPVTATVVQAEDADGRVVLSVRRARHRREWTDMEAMRRSGELIEAAVLEANRGGVVVDVGIRGFVPLSQLGSIGAIDMRAGGTPEPVHALVGKRLRLRVLEVDPERHRLILSEKAATQQVRRERKAHGVATLNDGDVLEGTIVSVTSYGAFVDVGVADGLVHRSEITWQKGVEPTSLCSVGQRVRVVVTAVDRERQRISLSIKRLADDPWDRFVKTVHVGQTLPATVTRLMPYGAFAKIAEGVEGLIHISELAAQRVADPQAIVSAGDVLPVRIVAVDTQRRRISLSARLGERG